MLGLRITGRASCLNARTIKALIFYIRFAIRTKERKTETVDRHAELHRNVIEMDEHLKSFLQHFLALNGKKGALRGIFKETCLGA